ncbi:MAG: hypothetical protein CO189_05485 [candidate division Zixibacteria bacterium CG_4_9_14_3_um_filter_46_8]|nr:MAG: hypothetical protein CO189_05485 [candidate division Zixibacteria bacterium CG_4_9_14_3_um_filter_46_8]
MMKLCTIRILIILVLMGISVFRISIAQDNFTSDPSEFGKDATSPIERRILIDAITAGVLPRASFDFDIRTFTYGGGQVALNVGLLKRLNIGLSYGAGRLLTEDTPLWNPNMEFLVKYRIFTENYAYPSLAIGYSSQGSGTWDKVNKRYAQKSKGIYLAATKSFLVYRNIVAFTGGINVSMEDRDRDKDPSAYFGAFTQVNDQLYFIVEYDLAINDNERYNVYGFGRGFLNIGLEWILTQSVSVEFDLRDLLQNRDVKSFDREVRLFYIEHF